jgi:hypothetical protein
MHTDYAARAAEQSDPAKNRQFSRWPAPATGPQDGTIRAWHAPDVPPPPPMTAARRRADREWRRIVRDAAP